MQIILNNNEAAALDAFLASADPALASEFHKAVKNNLLMTEDKSPLGEVCYSIDRELVVNLWACMGKHAATIVPMGKALYAAAKMFGKDLNTVVTVLTQKAQEQAYDIDEAARKMDEARRMMFEAENAMRAARGMPVAVDLRKENRTHHE